MPKFIVTPSSQFKKELKKYQNRKKEIKAIFDVVELLEGGHENIPSKMKPHVLSGNYNDFWECHVMPDLLVIWDETTEPVNKVYLVRVGSHSELFRK
ncbi:MAG: type II toxin-antitoxin system YafQ family toxin [Chitinophagaceae bacterium]